MTETQTRTARCTHLVERNGYYTGRRCHNDAKFLVNDDPMCGTHKNKMVRLYGPNAVVAPLLTTMPIPTA